MQKAREGFHQKEILSYVASLIVIISQNILFFLSAGIFILNLVCRDILLRGSVLAAIKETFPVLYTQKIEGEVNEIIFCQQQDKVKLSPRDLQAKAQILEKALQQPRQKWDSTYVLADMLETIRLV